MLKIEVEAAEKLGKGTRDAGYKLTKNIDEEAERLMKKLKQELKLL